MNCNRYYSKGKRAWLRRGGARGSRRCWSVARPVARRLIPYRLLCSLVCVLCFLRDRLKCACDLHKLRAIYITPEYCASRLVKFAAEPPLIPSFAAALKRTWLWPNGLSMSRANFGLASVLCALWPALFLLGFPQRPWEATGSNKEVIC